MLFSHYFQCLNLNMKKTLKIWKSKMAATSDVMLLWFPWKPVKQQVVSINWKYKEHFIFAKYQVNRMNAVKSRGEGSDWPPPTPYAFV